MTVKDLIDKNFFQVINEGEHIDREIKLPFCCDLLSVAMGQAPSGCAWVTVMANINTLAVASLCDAACIILAEGTAVDEHFVTKAGVEGITVLATEDPIFDAALKIHQALTV